jgi:DNA-directed RNA polymerase I subunit RPA1
MQSHEIISSEVSEIRFGLYSDDELRALSVCKIESPVTYGSTGVPLPTGLYDDRMGPQSMSSSPCVTCGAIYVNCPGHCGHIELCVPVYHPLLFKSLYGLLKAKCANCHRFRLHANKVAIHLVLMKLIEMGDLAAVDRLEALAMHSNTELQNVEFLEKINIDDEIDMYNRRYESFLMSNASRKVDMHTARLLSVKIAAFQNELTACTKCMNCHAFSPSIRKDGFAKVFEKPLSSVRIKHNKNKNIHYTVSKHLPVFVVYVTLLVYF